MWREIGEYFGLEVTDCPETSQPLEEQMAGVESIWREIAEKHALVEPDVGKLASWWHTDADLGRDQECVNDTTKSRDFGFDHFRETRGAFFDLLDRLRAEKIIPLSQQLGKAKALQVGLGVDRRRVLSFTEPVRFGVTATPVTRTWCVALLRSPSWSNF